MSSQNGPSQLLRGFEVLTRQDSCNFISFPPTSSGTAQLTAEQQLALGEVEILRALLKNDPTLAISSIKGTDANIADESVKVADPSDELFSDIMVNKNSVESNIAMALQYETTSASDSTVEIKISNAVSPVVKEICSLDTVSTPLFAANIDIEHIDGLLDGTSYKTITADKTGVLNTNTKSHTILLDKNDAEVTLFKYRNSVKGSAAEEGIKGEYDNTFNQELAFLTDIIIERDTDTNQLKPTVDVVKTLGKDYILTSDGLSSASEYNKLESEFVVGGEPTFGALKFVQAVPSIEMLGANNNTDDTSTMASYPPYRPNMPPISVPVKSLTESEFKALFSSAELETVDEGYKFNLTIGSDSFGGYTIATDENANKMPVITYDAKNELVASDDKVQLFRLDASAVTKNLAYMNAMKNIKNEDGSFPAHEIFVKNGDFKIDTASSNSNKALFDVLDGQEQLQVMTGDGVNDLTARGEITVKESNNTLDDLDARWTKVSAGSEAVSSLTVAYVSDDSSDEPGVGVLSDVLKNTYYVESKVTALTKTTITSDAADVWNTVGKDVAVADNTVLVFQDLVSGTNNDVITDFTATGLDALMTDNTKFALLQLTQCLKCSGNIVESVHNTGNSQLNVISEATLSDFDLTGAGMNDLRIAIYGKTVSDFRHQLNDGVVNPDSAYFHTASNHTSPLVYENGSFAIGNKGVLTSSLESTGNSWGPIVPLEADKESQVFVQIDYLVDKGDKNQFKIEIGYKGISDTAVLEDDDINIDAISEPVIVETTVTIPSAYIKYNPAYVLKKYVETAHFNASANVKIGAYSNLWVVQPVTQRTVTWKLFDAAGKQLADNTLKRIKDNVTGLSPYLTTKCFVNLLGEEVDTLYNAWLPKIADLFVAKVEVQYKQQSTSQWVSFASADGYKNDLDLTFDTETVLKFKALDNKEATVKMIIGAMDDQFQFGKVADLSSSADVMYAVELSTASGTTTFDASGYIYSIADHAGLLETNWSPYSKSALFLQGVGTPLALSTDVVYGPLSSDPAVPRQITVQMYDASTTNLLASFKSNHMIIDSFNMLSSKSGPFIKHEYIINSVVPETKAYTIEYLPSTRRPSPAAGKEEYYCKLAYGNNTGVCCNLFKDVVPAEVSTFKLRGDRVCIDLLANATDDVNSYGGLYSEFTEILPSVAGYPLPTNSTKHRNIVSKQFRGFINSSEVIGVIRTMTTVKLVIADVFHDDMNGAERSNVSRVWAKRGEVGAYTALESLSIKRPEARNIRNMDILMDQSETGEIGGIGIKLFTEYSMFNKGISRVGPYKIPITLQAADYKITVTTNKVTSTVKEGNVFDVVLKSFANQDLLATRINVYEVEQFQFINKGSRMTIYHSPKYLGDPRLFNSDDWTALSGFVNVDDEESMPTSEISDATLRAGIVIRPETEGLLKFKRIQPFFGTHTKYAILPRPIVRVSAFDIVSAPVTKYVDIDLTVNAHHPFSKDVSTVPNPYFALPAATPINDLELSFVNLTYNELRTINQPVFKFTMPTDIIKIYMGVGEVATSVKQVLFEGPASELSNDAISTYWKVSDFEGSFANKVWNIKFGQPGYSIGTTDLMSIPTSIAGQKNISITGIPSFALASSKSLTLRPLQGVKSIFYEIDHVYEPDSLNFTVTFKKLSTVSEGVGERANDINFGDSVSVASLKYQTYNPLIVKVESYSIDGTISDVLSDTPRNVVTLFREAAATLLANKTSITWTNAVDIASPFKRSPVTLAPLTKSGHKQLLEWLYVSAATPLKIFAFNRPKMYRVIRADGLPLVSISPDGIFDKFSANALSLIGTF